MRQQRPACGLFRASGGLKSAPRSNGSGSESAGLCEGGGDLRKDGLDADEARVGSETHLALEMLQERNGDLLDSCFDQRARGDARKDRAPFSLRSMSGGGHGRLFENGFGNSQPGSGIYIIGLAMKLFSRNCFRGRGGEDPGSRQAVKGRD